MTSVEIAIQARKRIETSWGQAPPFGFVPEGKCCILQAIWKDTTNVKDLLNYSRVDLIVGTIIRERYKIEILSAWNDAPGRTKEQVLEVLDEAINVLQNEATESKKEGN